MSEKCVLISIRPKWCELIASGKKTIEVRKSRPKLETPFKCYIYCTLQGSPEAFASWGKDVAKWNREGWGERKGKVIGEFVCDEIYKIDNCSNAFRIPSQDVAFTNQVANWSCLSFDQMKSYLRKGDGYGWHISDLKIYDKPKELSEFFRATGEMDVCANSTHCEACEHWRYVRVNSEEYDMDCDCGGPLFEQMKPITRPPQSWCYVEGD